MAGKVLSALGEAFSRAIKKFFANLKDFLIKFIQNLIGLNFDFTKLDLNNISLGTLLQFLNVTKDSVSAWAQEVLSENGYSQFVRQLSGAVVKIITTLVWEGWNALVKYLQSTFEKLKSTIESIVSDLPGKLWEQAKNFLSTLQNDFAEVVGSIIREIITGVLGKICSLLQIIADICAKLQALLDAIIAALWKLIEGAKKVVLWIDDAVIEAASNLILVGLIAGATALLGALVNVISSLKKLVDKIKDLIGKVRDFIKNAIKKALKSIYDLFAKGGPGDTCEINSGSCFIAGTVVKTPTGRQSIEALKVGGRVDPDLPEGWERIGVPLETPFTDWRELDLILLRNGAATGRATLLRPAAWLEEQNATVGETIFLNIPDIGFEGPTIVSDVRTTTVEPSPGRLITGVFHYASGDVYSIRVEGEPIPLGVTGTHPFWSLDREDWVSAASLRVGERLVGEKQSTRLVQSVSRTGTATEVFNLEIDSDHVYRVGTTGLLVHNGSPGTPTTKKKPTNCNCIPTVEFSLSGNADAVAAHIKYAQTKKRKPKILQFDADLGRRRDRRAAVCPAGTCTNSPAPNNSCDEYPFASTREGGAGASVRCVPSGTNSSQGGTLSQFYKNLKDGDYFCVKVVD